MDYKKKYIELRRVVVLMIIVWLLELVFLAINIQYRNNRINELERRVYNECKKI